MDTKDYMQFTMHYPAFQPFSCQFMNCIRTRGWQDTGTDLLSCEFQSGKVEYLIDCREGLTRSIWNTLLNKTGEYGKKKR